MKIMDFESISRTGSRRRLRGRLPTLPGCYSQGESVEDALANIREAIELCLEDMHDHGEERRTLQDSHR